MYIDKRWEEAMLKSRGAVAQDVEWGWLVTTRLLV